MSNRVVAKDNEQDDTVLKRIEEVRKNGDLPSDLLEFFRDLIQLQSRVEQQISAAGPASISKTDSQGGTYDVPLLLTHPVTLDIPMVRSATRELIALCSSYPQFFGTSADKISRLPVDEIITDDNVAAYCKGAEMQYDGEVDQAFLRNLVQTAIRPFFVVYARALKDKIDQENWRQGTCPVCGGQPDFSYLEQERGARWLVCSRCDTEWLFQRLRCPYCNNTDQKTLHYYTSDEGIYRLYVCDKCKHYLKTIDLRNARFEVFIPLERLLTMKIDTQAREQGYSPV